MKGRLEALVDENKKNAETCKPLFFRLKSKKDLENFNQLINTTPGIIVLDEILGQVEEYVKSKNPKKVFKKDELTKAALERLDKGPSEEYGVWVYYPWSKRLVHILDEEEFIEVRTNRNQYKITPEEKKLLSQKKVGVIGMSVGQSIALTIAMERICGEMRIADFDILELSNLNRIRAGVHSLGLLKTVMVVREIAEIDPFLKVTYYSDGLNEENVNAFFTEGGKLDVCIEVCDGLFAKIFARQKAKEFRVPVIMNSSDRGTTDIERYDLDPDQSLLHGLIDHLDISKVKEAKTNEEKVPYLLPMLGVDTSTYRLKASMLEIQETITTWPQLASGVILGGGICADVCRRVLLGELKKSGRYFVDLEDLINDNVVDYIESLKNKKEIIHVIPESNLPDYNPYVRNYEALKANDGDVLDVTEEKIRELVGAAILAPSGGNIQPWKWLWKNKKLFLFRDINRTESVLNYNNTAAHIALGAATENLILKASELGYKTDLDLFPLGAQNPLTSVFTFDKTNSAYKYQSLVKYIGSRCTNRMLSGRVPLKASDRQALQDLMKDQEGFRLNIFSDEAELGKIKDIIASVDKVYFTSYLGNRQFADELRWTQRENEVTRDGIDVETMDLTPTERAGLMVSRDWEVTSFIHEWHKGDAFKKMSLKAVDSAAAVCVLINDNLSEKTYFESGRLIEKLWLLCTSLNISFQPMSASTFLFARLTGNRASIEEIAEDLAVLRVRFDELNEIGKNQRGIFIFRLSYANEPDVKSLRRGLEQILMYG